MFGYKPNVVAAKMEHYDKIREYVVRGAQLLDQVRPGWERDIDTERLDVSSVLNCPLGQLYGDYHTGVDAIRSTLELPKKREEPFSSEEWMVIINKLRDHGFCCNSVESVTGIRWAADMDLLTETWKNLIENRLAVGI